MLDTVQKVLAEKFVGHDKHFFLTVLHDKCVIIPNEFILSAISSFCVTWGKRPDVAVHGKSFSLYNLVLPTLS